MVVHVDVVTIRMADLSKAVHIELADEGSKVAVLEVDREDLLREPADVVDAEGVTRGGPTDNLSIALVLNKGVSTSIIS